MRLNKAKFSILIYWWKVCRNGNQWLLNRFKRSSCYIVTSSSITSFTIGRQYTTCVLSTSLSFDQAFQLKSHSYQKITNMNFRCGRLRAIDFNSLQQQTDRQTHTNTNIFLLITYNRFTFEINSFLPSMRKFYISSDKISDSSANTWSFLICHVILALISLYSRSQDDLSASSQKQPSLITPFLTFIPYFLSKSSDWGNQ